MSEIRKLLDVLIDCPACAESNCGMAFILWGFCAHCGYELPPIVNES